MKYLFSLLLLLSNIIAEAQKNLHCDIILNVGAVLSSSKPNTRDMAGAALLDPVNNTITFLSGPYQVTYGFKTLISPKLSAGVNLYYTVRKDMNIYAGLELSLLKAKRENTMTFPVPVPAVSTIKTITTESFDFYNLDIPIGASYRYKKWSINLGFTPSIILHSTFTQVRKSSSSEISLISGTPYLPQDPQPSPDNKSKGFLSLSFAPFYQLTNKFKIGIGYNLALTKSYTVDYASRNIYQAMKTNTLDLKILYNLN
mgnify:CR=1 FL=1